jgi:hypothetical protein
VRDIAEGGGRLSVEVGGPGALNTDMNKVFGTLDATLLLATLGVVTVLLILIYRSPFLWLVPLAVAGVAAAMSMAAGYGLQGRTRLRHRGGGAAGHVPRADVPGDHRECAAQAADVVAGEALAGAGADGSAEGARAGCRQRPLTEGAPPLPEGRLPGRG